MRQLSSPLATGGSASASSKIVSLGLSVTKAPEAPTSLTLSTDALLKKDVVLGKIGQLLATDPDTAPTNLRYSKNDSGNDNNLVEISPTGEISLSPSITTAQLTAIRDRGYLSINVQVSDDTPEKALTKNATLRIAAEGDNKAPTIANLTPITLGAMTQGTSGDSNIIFKRIDNLFSGIFRDTTDTASSNKFNGVAIVANAASTNPLDGRWQYRSIGGSWTNVPTLSEETPFILSPTSELRFRASSAFSGTPGALSVRVLDNSKSYPEGLLDSNSVLISGFSGAASADIVQLQTSITPLPARAPEKIFFSTARNILIDGNGDVAAGTLLGTFAALDPDTAAKDLQFSGPFAATDPNQVAEKLEITNGNQLRVRSGETINSEDLKSFTFSTIVKDDTNKEFNSLAQFNTATQSVGTTFKLNALSFSKTEDTTIRSDTSVLPALSGFSQPILFSATGVAGELSVTVGATLAVDDLAGIKSADLGLTLPEGQTIESITPFAPLLEFTLKLDIPGSVARFEFELPSELPWANLQNIKYLKQFASGGLSVFDYFTDDFGISTGARLETKGEFQYEALTNASQITGGKPVYLAVYIQDNGRGDDDSRLGFILDPGAPALFGIRKEALELSFGSRPENIEAMVLSLGDTNGDGISTVQFVSNREAVFDNIVNYFKVDNVATGSVTIGVTEYRPEGIYAPDGSYAKYATGDGYIQHVIEGPGATILNASGTNPNLSTANLTESAKTLNFTSGGFWMPYVRVINTGATYLPYAAANADGFTHFAQARGSDGYNYLYLEDLPGGGDKDFDDLVIRISTPT